MEMGRGYLTSVGPWLILLSLRHAGSQGKKGPPHLILSHDGGKSWLRWVKYLQPCGLLLSYVAEVRRSRRGGNSLLSCEHPLSLPWQCGQAARYWWVQLALLSSSSSTESSVAVFSCLHPAGVRTRVVPELQGSLWAFHRP